MSTVAATHVDDSTVVEKAIAAFTGFGFACATFILSTLVLVPVTFYLTGMLHMPQWVGGALVFFEMFGLTAIAGIYGVVVAERGITAHRHDNQEDCVAA